MNENIERVLAELDGFRMADEMTYSAYSRLHDLISELDDLLKAQEPKPVKFSINSYNHKLYYCPNCNRFFEFKKPLYCDECGQAVKWDEPPKEECF